jgi:hypothetical protein
MIHKKLQFICYNVLILNSYTKKCIYSTSTFFLGLCLWKRVMKLKKKGL